VGEAEVESPQNVLAVGGTSGLAESCSFSMRAGSHLFVAAGSLTTWRSGCTSLILCQLVSCDPMQVGAAVLHADWLDGRSLGDWHLG
jgi:hypothetical protein